MLSLYDARTTRRPGFRVHLYCTPPWISYTRLRRTIHAEGIRLSVGTYCWTFHRSADKLRLTKVRDRAGVLHEAPAAVARCLQEFWGGVMGGGGRGIAECQRYIESLPMPMRVRQALPLLFRELNEDIVVAALERMKRGSAPGMDGIPAEVYQSMPDVFAPKLHEVMQVFLARGGGVPDSWGTSLLKCLPKFAGAEKPEDLRPLALQSACLKWVSTVIMLQTIDALQQLIPPEQKGFLPGRHMVDHIVYARSEWERLPEQIMVAVDFRKAYDSVTFTMMEASLRFLGLREQYVKLLLSVMAAPVLFCVGRTFEPSVFLHPRSGIRQGDPLSPLLFDVITVFLIYDIKSLHVDVQILLYADDILFCVPGCGLQQRRDLRVVLYRLRVFRIFSGLQVNPQKTYAILKSPGLDPQPKTVAGVIVKKDIRYLGVQLGNITSDAAYARVIARMLLRARAMAALPLRLEEKAFLFASWVAPVCYLTARAYQPSQHVCSQMDMVHRTALGIQGGGKFRQGRISWGKFRR